MKPFRFKTRRDPKTDQYVSFTDTTPEPHYYREKPPAKIPRMGYVAGMNSHWINRNTGWRINLEVVHPEDLDLHLDALFVRYLGQE